MKRKALTNQLPYQSVGGVVELTLEVQCRDNKPILHCKGHLIYGDEAEALLAAVARLTSSAEHITVSLRGLRKMDCAGLGALVAARNVARERGRSMGLCAVPTKVQRMISLTGLEEVLCYAEETAEAAA